ncbi:MAG: tryptophan-rich sensory protein [Sedimentisphaerales bacterium]|nr:tryptophan-rich sensory protein [Sedimentisphaerales bacterium]
MAYFRSAVALGIAMAFPLAVGIGSSFAMRGSIEGWYSQLNRPPLTPPDWLFGPVWTILYLLMGIASFLVWRKRKGTQQRQVRLALFFYALQLLLNGLWTPLFFGIHKVGIALTEISLLWLVLLITIKQFKDVSLRAALLLWPYLFWISFAVYLNAGFWWLNR